jgi:hypothetical protein
VFAFSKLIISAFPFSAGMRKRSRTRIYRNHPAAPNIHALGTAALADIQPDRRDK